jgi:pyruvate/2-oxoglutarate dehydrogenase complex dihydrolipoamide dehydrogenase (E3) component
MRSHVAIIGAGPYGLSTAAHLEHAGIETIVFGETMGAWSRMPSEMLLRSAREATNIGHPGGRMSIEVFGAERGKPVPTPVPLCDFVAYGKWFQERAVPNLDSRLVSEIERMNGAFRLSLSDDSSLDAQAVVVAAGIEPFAYIPPELMGFDAGLVTHSSEHVAFDRFNGQRLLVVGAGQSALEWAVLSAEAGAHVEVLARRRLRFLRGERFDDNSGALHTALYPSLGVGPPGINRIMGSPHVFRRLPQHVATPLARRAVRPAVTTWLKPRLTAVAVTSGVRITAVGQNDHELTVMLNDGSERRADHLIAATGYRVDVTKYSFMSPDLAVSIRRIDGSPWLNQSYESSVPGLHFVGATAARMMGPGMRFVSHSGAAAAAVRQRLAQRRSIFQLSDWPA